MTNNNKVDNCNTIESIKTAYMFCTSDFTYNDIIKELQFGNDLKKQSCIIKLSEIKSQKDADILVSNLTNQTGLIREVSAVKLNELIKNEDFNIFFQSTEVLDALFNAVLDVNPTVCRNIIEILCYIENTAYLSGKLIEKFLEIYGEIKNFKGSKSHSTTKKIFKLYWCLEALFYIIEEFEKDNNFENIITIASNFDDYTIREKAAKILAKTSKKQPYVIELKKVLKNDKNLFVKRYLL